MLKQIAPAHFCTRAHFLKTKRPCGNPRCSLQCRKIFAAKQRVLLERMLRLWRAWGYFIWFGNLSISPEPRLLDYSKVRQEFLRQIKLYSKKKGVIVEFYAIAEIGHRTGRLHEHFVLISSEAIAQADVKKWWDTAVGILNTGSFTNTVKCDPPRKELIAGVSYMTKDLKAYREGRKQHILFEKKTLRITWSTRGFFRLGGKSNFEASNQKGIHQELMRYNYFQKF